MYKIGDKVKVIGVIDNEIEWPPRDKQGKFIKHGIGIIMDLYPDWGTPEDCGYQVTFLHSNHMDMFWSEELSKIDR